MNKWDKNKRRNTVLLVVVVADVDVVVVVFVVVVIVVIVVVVCVVVVIVVCVVPIVFVVVFDITIRGITVATIIRRASRDRHKEMHEHRPQICLK